MGLGGAIQILPYEPLSLDPSVSCLHYGQLIFEGLKAFRQPDNSIATLRGPPDPAARPRRPAPPLTAPRTRNRPASRRPPSWISRKPSTCAFGQVSRCVQPSAGARPGNLAARTTRSGLTSKRGATTAGKRPLPRVKDGQKARSVRVRRQGLEPRTRGLRGAGRSQEPGARPWGDAGLPGVRCAR